MAIHPEVRDLDAELASHGGCAQFIMDDGYACGPASVVLESVARFGRRLFESLGLVLNGSKLSCWSHRYAVPTCPFRARHLPFRARHLGCYSAAELSRPPPLGSDAWLLVRP